MLATVTMVSYAALLLLLMPVSKIGVIETAVMLALGFGLMLWKKPWKHKLQRSKLSWIITIPTVAYLGVCFYNKWTFVSILGRITSLLPVSERVVCVLVAVAAVCGAAIAGFFVFAIAQQIRNLLLDTNEKRAIAIDLFRCLIASAVAVILAQIMSSADVLSMGYFKFIWGMLIVLTVAAIVYCLSGSAKLSVLLGTIPFMVISTVNVYVYQFRGRLFEPVDVFSAGTVMNVASNYEFFPIPFLIVLGWGIWVCMLIAVFRSCPKEKHKVPGKQRLFVAAGCLVSVIAIACYAANLETYQWQNKGAVQNGYVLDFVAKVKDAYVQEPDGYSVEAIDQLADRYSQNGEEPVDKPHIIVIMDEAYADLSVLGALSTNQEVAPYISSLKQNTVSGYALASVYGGNTANSEFEFLTGNSMAWMSPNAVPYQQFIRSSAYSMVSYLKDNYGYHCIAMHPHWADGWNRPNVYGHLGFDESIFAEDLPDNLPDTSYIREYISDQKMFEMIVEKFEQQKDAPMFLFGVTIQNHGGYSARDDSYEQSVWLTGCDGDYPRVDNYLSLIHQTDRAVEYLISYFQSVDERVVIAFFGDHQPSLDEEFYSEIAGEDGDSLEAQQNRYKVPFFVWANYEIAEKSVECTSLNYLSTYVYEAAGIPMPTYNRFLADMEQYIPAINANGFYSRKEQGYLPFHQASGEEKTWLQLYEQLQYNNIFDEKHRNESFFPVLQP